MQDYDFMLTAIDEVISHEVAGVICMENYKSCYFPNGFRRIFDLFCEFWAEYEEKREKFQNKETQKLEFLNFQAECRIKREKILEDFVKELKKIESEIDYEAEIKNYKIALSETDIQNSEMNLSIYPLLISLIRKKEEGESKI